MAQRLNGSTAQRLNGFHTVDVGGVVDGDDGDAAALGELEAGEGGVLDGEGPGGFEGHVQELGEEGGDGVAVRDDHDGGIGVFADDAAERGRGALAELLDRFAAGRRLDAAGEEVAEEVAVGLGDFAAGAGFPFAVVHLAEAGIEDGRERWKMFEGVLGGLRRTGEVGRVGGVDFEAKGLEALAEGAGLGDAERGEVGFEVSAEAAFGVAEALAVADEEDASGHVRECTGRRDEGRGSEHRNAGTQEGGSAGGRRRAVMGKRWTVGAWLCSFYERFTAQRQHLAGLRRFDWCMYRSGLLR